MYGSEKVKNVFSYRAIKKMTCDLAGGHFTKWPPKGI